MFDRGMRQFRCAEVSRVCLLFLIRLGCVKFRPQQRQKNIRLCLNAESLFLRNELKRPFLIGQVRIQIPGLQNGACLLLISRWLHLD